MEGILSLAAIFAFCMIANQVIRVYMTAKHPKALDAWDAVEERQKGALNKKMATGPPRCGAALASAQEFL